MSRFPGANPDYLRNEQYADGGNLSARISLHARFSTNQYGWFRWVFDRIRPEHGECIVEVGCGTAMLWREMIARVPVECRVVLTDFSPGMLAEARTGLGGQASRFDMAVVDAQSLPFSDYSVDLVIANHMLYHVPDRDRAISELRRILRPGGRLFASTIGRNHLRELDDLLAFLLSTSARPALSDERLAGIRAQVEAEITERGAFRVTKETGLFTCRV